MAESLVVGIDLDERNASISLCLNPSEGVITYSPEEGKDDFKIPLAAFTVPGSGKRFFGQEAVRSADSFGLEYDTDLYTRALKKAEEDGSYEESTEVRILGEYLSWLLRLPPETALNSVMALCITVRNVLHLTGKVINAAMKAAGIGIKSVRVISYAESFFYYALGQPVGLWRNGVLLYDYSDDLFQAAMLETDHSTSPALVKYKSKERDGMLPFFGADRRKLDERLLSIVSEDLKTGISATYLTGEAFNERWEQRTLKYICARSRVFLGQNLYTKGACYGAADMARLIRITGRYLFLGEDSLNVNVSIRALSHGREVLLPVSDAGDLWYEGGRSIEVLLGHDRELIVVITDIKDGSERNVVIRLDWLPERPERASRIKAEFTFQSRDKLTVVLTDLGFGEQFRATGLVRSEEIEL